MPYLWVYRIEDSTAEYTEKELRGNRLEFKVSGKTRIESVKEHVATRTGVPPERQRYYGVSGIYLDGLSRCKYRFTGEEILRQSGRNDAADADSDSALAVATLKTLERRMRISCWDELAVVFLPDSGSGGGNDDLRLVQLVTTAEAHKKRVATAGQADTFEIHEDSDDEGGSIKLPRPKKRARREDGTAARAGQANEESGNPAAAPVGAPSASRSSGTGRVAREEAGGGIRAAAGGKKASRSAGGLEENSGDRKDAGVNPAAAARTHGDDYRDGNHGQGNGSNVKREADSADDEDARAGGEVGAPAEAEVAGAAVPTTAAAAEEVQAARHAAPSELRRWLRDLGADGTPEGRFERYARAFEREFGSLEDVALVADNPSHGVESILQTCGVRRLGDRGRLEWAIGGLPRPGPAATTS